MHTNMPIAQWHVLRNDKWLLSCITWIPILLAVSVWWIFSEGVARDVNFGVVDLENSTLSRELVREFDATATLKVTRSYQSASEAKHALINGDVYAYAIIPKHYSRDIYLGNTPQVSVFYNSQYILIGRLINSAIVQAHGTFNAKLGVVKQLAKGDTSVASAAGKTITIQNQITALFNRNTNYAQFLVSAIVPALWQIIIIVATILALTANHRIYGLRGMLGENPLRGAVNILAFYLPFFLLLGFGFLSWFYIGFKWPMEGSLLPILFAQLLTVVACLIMGAFFFFLTLDPARAMSFAGAFTAPSFAFMGVTFPASDMGFLASTWRSLLPVSHYIEAQISQISYGVTQFETISLVSGHMAGYIVPLVLIYPLCKKHLAKLEQQS
ncbi:ABC transporter permease [Vibrio sp. DW001]|uniref:ABC transporter permease n=1 Tax=Vibrio sp. DW001 TaxID=2912315 RepID=UPI0023AF6B8A|nr:ABC transporter permease [Vibrio sp. DW001]WED25190.1 ABC transporter permease [Vibrio sp. DW001]